MSAICDIAKRHSVRVVEDCAQSHGAMWQGKRAGSFGSVAAFSFYPTKNLGALGDGGMVITADRELGDRLRLLREYGWKQRYVSTIQGVNSRLDELQAAMLRVKLRSLDVENDRRRSLASLYDKHLAGESLILPRTKPDAVHVFHQYVIRYGERDRLKEFLQGRGIGTLIHYPVPIHKQPAYAGALTGRGGLPRTERAANEILSLPMFPELTDDQVRSVAQQIAACLAEAR
jgi:dTDP-4-amino-4,6-dideoxygalactose transaminase